MTVVFKMVESFTTQHSLILERWKLKGCIFRVWFCAHWNHRLQIIWVKSPWFLRQCQVRSKYPIREEDHPGEFSVTLKRRTFPDSKIFYKLKMISENLLRFLGPHFWIQYFRRLLFAKCNLALHVNSSITIKKKTIWNRHYLDFDAISWAAKSEQAFGRSHSLYPMFPGRSSQLARIPQSICPVTSHLTGRISR